MKKIKMPSGSRMVTMGDVVRIDTVDPPGEDFEPSLSGDGTALVIPQFKQPYRRDTE